MKSKKNYGEDNSLPLHNNSLQKQNRKDKKSVTHTLFSHKKLTPEQEINLMRAQERQARAASEEKTENTPKKKNTKKSGEQKNVKNAAPKKKPQKKSEENKARHSAKGENTKKKSTANKSAKNGAKQKAAVRIIPLGGLGEIGKNMTAVESGEDIIVIDAGLGFPDDDMLGVDLVIPDTEYLEKNAARVRGIFLTHGHEDHIGSVPFVLRKLSVPVFGTKLTLGIVENKLIEARVKGDLNVIRPGERVKAGCFEVEPISVNHSIADAVAYAIHSPCGILIFTGDFKIDSTPIDGEMTDLTRFGELGREGVTALFCDSTNCERPGFTPSERTVGTSFEQIFDGNKKRVIVATFSSNIHRVQQIIDASVKHERAVCVMGRSMINIVTTAKNLGYMKIPEGTLISPEEIRKFSPEHVTLITTGSQGEAMSALSRMAFGSHDKVKLTSEDMVVISAHPIPGNEKAINNIINELTKQHVRVAYDQIAEVHVSGHACQEEIKMIFALTKPRFFMPVHGEYKHLSRNAALAEYAGIPRENIFISDIGRVLEISADGKKAALNGTVPAGKLLVDGSGVGDVGSAVLRDRKLLSQDGIIMIAAAVDSYGKTLVSKPEIVSRGFIYVKENEDLIGEIASLAARVIDKGLAGGQDFATIKNRVKDETGRLLFNKTRRRPIILPVIVEA